MLGIAERSNSVGSAISRRSSSLHRDVRDGDQIGLPCLYFIFLFEFFVVCNVLVIADSAGSATSRQSRRSTSARRHVRDSSHRNGLTCLFLLFSFFLFVCFL